jgi:hypothetical protein
LESKIGEKMSYLRQLDEQAGLDAESSQGI